MASGSKKVVFASIAANGSIAVAKFAAASFTGSSAMFSEAVHSVVDTGNQALLLIGLARAERPADSTHPFGYSKEIYFWSFVVSIVIFAAPMQSDVMFFAGAGLIGFGGGLFAVATLQALRAYENGAVDEALFHASGGGALTSEVLRHAERGRSFGARSPASVGGLKRPGRRHGWPLGKTTSSDGGVGGSRTPTPYGTRSLV